MSIYLCSILSVFAILVYHIQIHLMEQIHLKHVVQHCNGALYGLSLIQTRGHQFNKHLEVNLQM